MSLAETHRQYLASALIEANARLRTMSRQRSPLVGEEETRAWLLAQGLDLVCHRAREGIPVTYLYHDHARETSQRKGCLTSFAVLPATTRYPEPREELPFWCTVDGMVGYYAHYPGREPVMVARRECKGDRLIYPKNIYSALAEAPVITPARARFRA